MIPNMDMQEFEILTPLEVVEVFIKNRSFNDKISYLNILCFFYLQKEFFLSFSENKF